MTRAANSAKDEPECVFIESIETTVSDPKDHLEWFFESGKETFETAYRLSIIKSCLYRGSKPHAFIQLLKGFLKALSTQDPTHIHYAIIREMLNESDPSFLKDTQAIDMLRAF
ncbi:MAG: hypothetical protein JSR46_08295 [Verrucomicrobia bacterium]|nr:hypothetical protein [Verrucomicrobiota bacterium]